MVALLAGHGIPSFVMLVGLVAMAGAAYARANDGGNPLAEHGVVTGVFVVLWTISIATGETVFLLEYVGHH